MKKALCVLLAAIMLFSFAACGGNSGKAPSPSKEVSTSNNTSAEQNPASSPAITIALDAVPNELHPLTNDIASCLTCVNHIFDKLVDFDQEFNWVPAIATSWEQLDDYTWNFTIDLDAKFQNGDPLTMDDVVYSLELIASTPKTADAGRYIESVSYEGNVLTLKVSDNNAAVIPRILSLSYILNKAYIEKNGDAGLYTAPMGTGPYKVAEFVPGNTLVMETWEGYYKEKPQIGKISVIGISEAASLYIAVETGKAQYAGFVSALETGLAEGNKNLYVQTDSSNIVRDINLNCEKGPFTDVRVRRAIAHALDRDSWCSLNGGHQPTKSMLANTFAYYHESDNLPEYDLEKARALLAEAGYNESNPLSFELITYKDDSGVEILQSDLKSIGVNMTVTLLEFSVYLSREGAGDFDACFCGQDTTAGTAIQDCERFDYTFAGTRDVSFYSSAEADALIKTIRTTMDENERTRAFTELSDLIAYDCPMIPVYLDTLHSVMVKELTGVTVRSDNVISFRNAVYTG